MKITESAIVTSNINGMGNEVGIITNRVTSQMEVQAKFEKGSKEYTILADRILCGQLYQQNSIDKIKGIIASDMPRNWYNRKLSIENNDYNLCADKKPYFMIYIYKKLKREYKQYLNDCQEKCMTLFGIPLEELLLIKDLNEEQQKFINLLNRYNPVGKNPCVMNKICFKVEKELQGYKSKLKKSQFDYTFLKWGVRINQTRSKRIANLYDVYQQEVKSFAVRNYLTKLDKEHSLQMRNELKERFKEQTAMICENPKERLDIILSLCYNNNQSKQFAWDTVGDLIIERLKNKQ